MSKVYKLIRDASLSLAMIIIMSGISYAQDSGIPDETQKRFGLQLSLGYNSFSLKDPQDFQKALIDYYRNNNVPIEEQRNYPGNVLIGLNGLYRINPKIRVGLGLRYTASPAKSAYEDYSGTLEVTGSARMFTLEGIAEFHPNASGTIHPFFGIRGGLVMGYYDVKEEIKSSSYPGLEGTAEIDGNGTGYSVEGYLGAGRPIGSFDLQLQVGYRYALVKEMDATLKENGAKIGSGTLDMEFDFSGIIALATISLPL